MQPRAEWVRGDFNGLFGDLLCLSHDDTVRVIDGGEIPLRAGMTLTAAEPDEEDGEPLWLMATGTVEPSPEWLECRGSRWVLRIDERGVHDLPRGPEA